MHMGTCPVSSCKDVVRDVAPVSGCVYFDMEVSYIQKPTGLRRAWLGRPQNKFIHSLESYTPEIWRIDTKKRAYFKGVTISKPSTPLHDSQAITLPPNTFGRVEEPWNFKWRETFRNGELQQTNRHYQHDNCISLCTSSNHTFFDLSWNEFCFFLIIDKIPFYHIKIRNVLKMIDPILIVLQIHTSNP